MTSLNINDLLNLERPFKGKMLWGPLVLRVYSKYCNKSISADYNLLILKQVDIFHVNN